MANPARRVVRAVALADAAEGLSHAAAGVPRRPAVEILDRPALAALLPPAAVHQGLALLVEPLAAVDLGTLLAGVAGRPALVVVLDQANDPQNIGAVLRAAAAFGADGVIVQDRHAPEATAAMAKAASGALETVPLVRVVNIARTLRTLQQDAFTVVGLEGSAAMDIAAAAGGERTALVVGAEGAGLRRLVGETCDVLVRIPISPAMESLNLATAAAIALYVFRSANATGNAGRRADGTEGAA